MQGGLSIAGAAWRTPIIQRLSGEKSHRTTVLIIDGDLGFVFWLGHLLDAEAYSALPARAVPDAALLVMQLDLIVDVLVINLALAGADEFIAAMHRRKEGVKVIGIQKNPLTAMDIPGVNAIYHPSPNILDHMAKAEWLKCIEQVLSNSVQSTSN
jgi:hypothetical protein